MAGLTSALVLGAATIGGSAIASGGAKKQAQAAQNTAQDNNALQERIFQQQRADLEPWRQSGSAALAEINRRLGLNTASPAQSQAQQQYAPYMSNVNIPGGGSVNPTNPQMQMVNDLAYSPAMVGQPQRETMQATAAPAGTVGTGQYGAATPVPNTGTPVNPNDPQNRYGGFYASPGYQFRFDEGQRGINANRAASGMLQSGDTLKALTRYGQDYASNEYNTQLNQLFSVAGLGQTATGQGNALAGNYASAVGQNNQAASNALQSSYGTQANTWGNALGTLGGIAAYGLGGGGGAAAAGSVPKDLWGLF